MKKILLAISAVLLMATMANAQQKSIFGVRAGVNFSSISGDVEGSDGRTSFHAGVSYQQLLTSSTPLYLETGLYLSDKGDKFSYTDYDYNDNPVHNTDKVNLMYLQVPVMLNYHYNLTEGLDFIPAAGLYASYGIGGSFTDDKYKDILKKFDFGARFGIGLSYQKFYFGVSYDLGLSNFYDGEGNSSIKNRCWGISLGYNF